MVSAGSSWYTANHSRSNRQSGRYKAPRLSSLGEELFAGAGGRTAAMGYAADGVRQQFTSKERDIETGLDYFGARYYSSTQGRFSGVDPGNYQARLDLSAPQSWNAYSYVDNNPLVRVD